MHQSTFGMKCIFCDRRESIYSSLPRTLFSNCFVISAIVEKEGPPADNLPQR